MQQPPNYPNYEGWQQPQPPPYQPETYPSGNPHQTPNLLQQQFQPGPPPPFQAPQPPKKKRSLRLWIVLGIVGVLLLGSVGTVVLSSSSGGSQIVKVGQTITINNMDATLTGIGQLTFDAVIYSNEDIAVHVQLVNHSSNEQDYSPLDFHVKSGSGNITNLEAIPPDTYQSNNLLRTGSLTAGGTVEGDIVFQVTAEDHKAELLWRPDGSISDTGWNLGL